MCLDNYKRIYNFGWKYLEPGSSRCRWEANIQMGFKEIGCDDVD
jgi:hypothetical protein